jgi:hypothetical protein
METKDVISSWEFIATKISLFQVDLDILNLEWSAIDLNFFRLEHCMNLYRLNFIESLSLNSMKNKLAGPNHLV